MAMVKGMSDADAMMESMMQDDNDDMQGGEAVDALKAAIAMHQMHLDDPATATPESQDELMQLLKQALAMLSPEDADETSGPSSQPMSAM